MNIKTLLSIMALAALTACGDGCETVDTASVTAPVVIETASTVPAPVVEPTPVKLPYPVLPPSPVTNNPNTVCTTTKYGVEVCTTQEPVSVCAQDSGCAGDLNGCYPVKPCI
jgi:hypothetical protein